MSAEDSKTNSEGEQLKDSFQDALESQQPKESDEELKRQLADVQQDIEVLRSALADKIKKEGELKSLLGLNIMHDIQEDISQTMHDIKRSSVYQRTSEGLKLASDKIAPHFELINENIRKQAATLKNTSMFKSFEEGMMNTWSSMKFRIMGENISSSSQGPSSNEAGRGEGRSISMTERTAFHKVDRTVVHDGLLETPRSGGKSTDYRGESPSADFRRMHEDQLMNIDKPPGKINKKNY